MNLARVLPVFSVVFAVVYVAAMENNWALFTYHPQLGQWGMLVQPPKTGPAMYWYGWLATAALASIASSVVALAAPQGLASKIQSWWAWVIPLGTLIIVAYLLRGYFLR